MYETGQESEVVYVGKKPVMNYVLACLTMFQNGSREVVLKARGLAISKAVDAAQITTVKFAPDTVVAGIKIDTEQVEGGEASSGMAVSSIEIRLTKK